MRFQFGTHLVDLDRRELHRDGAPVVVEPRVFDLLVHLLRNRDHVVSKDAMIQHVWGGRIVSDAAIDSGVKAVRQAVGDSGAAQLVIRTIPRKGVRFVAEVRAQPDTPPAPEAARLDPRPLPTPLAPPGKPSIAVLAFTNMSSDPEQEFFSDGIAEDIITALSRYRSLFVIARNSSFTYKGRAVDTVAVGRDLGVRYVLEGSVRKAGDRVRVTGQLIDAETGNHLWAERYDRRLADIFAVQDEITAAVSIAIAPAINDAELHRAMRKPPDSLDAWAAYQRGLWHLAKGTAEETIVAEGWFRRAIELDANFAGGYHRLAWTLVVAGAQFQIYGLADVLPAAETFARRAIALDGADAEAYACLSGTLLQRHADYPGARAAAERALTLNPNLASAHGELGRTLIFSDAPREGLAAVAMSMRLDPCDPLVADRLNQMAIGHYYCRDYEASAKAARQAILAYPDHPLAYRWLAAALGQVGRIAEASDALMRATTSAPASFDFFVRQRVRWHRPEDYEHMLEGLRKAGWDG